ncbi:MAG: hypothetical protein ABI210_14040 [Abditibacteriaceae bacterium]
MADLLNEPQARALRSTFARLEELLDRSQRLRARQEAPSEDVFLRHMGNLSEQQSEQLEQQERNARDVLRRLHGIFHLEAETVNLEHRLVSQCALMGADLQEFLPEHWHGSGELDPRTVHILNTAIPELIDAMQQMVDALE